MAPGAIETFAGEEAAVDHVLRAAQPGDLVVVLADAVTRSWKQVLRFGGNEADEPPVGEVGEAEPPAGGVGIGSLLGTGEYRHEARGGRLEPSVARPMDGRGAAAQ